MSKINGEILETESSVKQILQDTNGKPSSKRIAGFVLMGVGLAYLLVVGSISIGQVIADPATALSVGQTIIYVGGALCGIGVIEKLGTGN